MVTQTIAATVRILYRDGSSNGGVKMYKRKTVDCYAIESHYGIECNCDDLQDAKARLADYKGNVTYPVWIKKWRERKDKA